VQKAQDQDNLGKQSDERRASGLPAVRVGGLWLPVRREIVCFFSNDAISFGQMLFIGGLRQSGSQSASARRRHGQKSLLSAPVEMVFISRSHHVEKQKARTQRECTGLGHNLPQSVLREMKCAVGLVPQTSCI